MDSLEHTLDQLVISDSAATGVVVVPEADWLRYADFIRQGPDLLLVGRGGKNILVENYFSGAKSPVLIDPSGAVFPPDLVSKLAGPVAPGQIAQSSAVEQAGPIGRIETIGGSVEITRADGTKGTIKKMTLYFRGTLLKQVRMVILEFYWLMTVYFH